MSALRALFDGGLPQLVMFDLDGTLVDSVPDLAAAVNHMLGQLGRVPAGIEQVGDWVGNGAPVLVRRALAGSVDHVGVDEEEAEAALQIFLQAYGGAHELTTLYPGVTSCLDWLQQQDVRMAVVTNKPQRFVEPLLREMGIAGFFDWLIGGDTLPVKKPDPSALFHVMQMARVTPQQSLFVGDSRNDVLAARAAGVRMVAVPYGYNHGRPIAGENPDLLVDSLDALI